MNGIRNNDSGVRLEWRSKKWRNFLEGAREEKEKRSSALCTVQVRMAQCGKIIIMRCDSMRVDNERAVVLYRIEYRLGAGPTRRSFCFLGFPRLLIANTRT